MKKHSSFYDCYLPKFVENCLKQTDVKTVFDVGAGDGVFEYAIYKKFPGKKYYGIEKNNDRVVKAQNVLCGSFPEDTKHLKPFDLVICHHVIEHIEDESSVLKELKRLTGKYLYIATPLRCKIHMGYYRNAKGERVLDPTHLREYTCASDFTRKVLRNMKGMNQTITPMAFAVTDYILPRISANQNIYDNKLLALLRRIKLPIIGYFNLEVLAWK